MSLLPRDTSRARHIVRLASALVKNKAAKTWLLEDPRGTWELQVCGLLESTRTRATKLRFSSEQVDTEIAVHIGFLALSALLENAKKNSYSARGATNGN